jgi:4-hydroxyphenylpyruvate dioxygenase
MASRVRQTPPRPQVELDVLELWVGDLGNAQRVLTTLFGFEPVDADLRSSQEEEAVCLAAGNVTFLLRQGMSAASTTARYVARHGDSIADVAMVCDEVGAVVDRALAQGLKVTSAGGCPRIDLLGDGTILHSLRDRKLASHPDRRARHDRLQMRAIDHFTYCLPWGTIEHVARSYSEIFGLESIHVQGCDEVGDSADGMRSTVLRSPAGFAVVLTEPMSSNGGGQTQRFLQAHAGPGVQHVAFAYDDLAAAVETLRSNGVSFLSIPQEHLERCHRRLGDRALAWDALRRNGILVDADEDGLLFQLFTLPITGRSSFFLELIERAGATGFGANNVRALFAAVDSAMRDPATRLWRPAPSDRAWIQELVGSARASIPFYRDHLAHVDASSLASLPSFDKAMTSKYGRFPMSIGGAPGAHRVLATSGTSGDRLYVSLDEGEWERTANWLGAVGRRVGITPEDVLLNTHCYGLWVGGPALDLLANRCGAGLIPLGPVPPEAVLELLADGVGTAISATPSYLRRLLEIAHATGFDLTTTPLRLGFIGAEPAEGALRRKFLSQLPEGFSWIELYGLTETGGPSVAFAPDPTVAELELNVADFWVEVLDPTADRAVPLGEVGELTITTRRTDGRTPLVRYRTRDLVRVTAGEAEAPMRISRILGRTDDSLKVGGVLVYPSALAEIMSELMPATAEWRALVIRREPDNELLLEAEASPDLCRTVEKAFRDRVGLSLTVSSLQEGVLARSREKTKRILIDSATRGTDSPR